MLFANFDLPVISSNDFPCKATIFANFSLNVDLKQQFP